MPDWKRDLRQQLAHLHFVPAREAEVIEELSEHLDDRWKELVSGGASADEATATVRSEMVEGDLLTRRLATLRQAHRAEPPVPGAPRRWLLADLLQDLRYAVRGLRRQPGFAAAAIVTLALGIGANAAIFTLVNATFLRLTPVTDPDRLVFIRNGPGSVFSYPAYASIRDQNDVMSDVVAWGGIQGSLNRSGDVDLVDGLIVTGNFFEVLGIRAALGRVLQRTDDVTPMAHPVVVVSHGLWQQRFGGAPDVIGQHVLLNGQPFAVVGVLDPTFRGFGPGEGSGVFVPMMMQPLMRPPRAGYSGEMNPDLLHNPDNGWLSLMGKLKPEVTLEQATSSLTVLASRLDDARRQGQPRPANAPPPQLPLTRFSDNPGLREVLPAVGLLFAVVGAVLLIACANVANLLVSRAVSRRRETALRLALGASRWRLVRQLLTESVLLATVAGAAGVMLAWAIVQWATAALGGLLPFSTDFSIDGRVLVFTLVVSMLTGILFGLVPALSASRPALVPALKDGSGSGVLAGLGSAKLGLKRSLVVLQVAVSLVLLVTAGLFVRSLRAAEAINPGFDVDRLVSTRLSINLLRYTRVQGQEFYRRVAEDVDQLPGVESTALARVAVATGGRRTLSLQVEGRPGSGRRSRSESSGSGLGRLGASANDTESSAVNVVSAGFFRTLGIPLLRGRDFSATDGEGSPRVAVVNETMATLWFPNEEPLGRRLNFEGGKGPWVEIVGLVRDSTYGSIGESPVSVVYLPLSQNHETGVTLYVRVAGQPAAAIAPIRRAVQAIEPNLPMPDVLPVAQTVGLTLQLARLGTLLISGFGGLALLLASLGIYGVLAFSVAQRMPELGVRLALGATRGNIFSLIVREGLWLVVIGTAIGLVAAAYGSRLLQTFLFGISPTDTWTFVGVSTLLSAVALAACVIPARRATRVNPIGVLKAN